MRRIEWAERRDAGAAGHPRALRARATARGQARRRLPPRHHRDGEPDAHAPGGRRLGRALRLQSALDPGRCRGGARRGLRDPDLRDQGRGQRHLLRPHRSGLRPPSRADNGRRRRRDQRPARQAPRAALRGDRRHRGDDDRRDQAEGAREGRAARLSDHRRQRRADQAPVRQPLRHRPVDDRRRSACDQRPAGGAQRGRRRLRLVRARSRHARQGHGRERDRHRDRSAQGDRGGHGRLSGHDRCCEAAEIGEVFITATGDKSVITGEHVERMRDGAILANTGHFNVEIDIPSIRALARKHARGAPVRRGVRARRTGAASTCLPKAAWSISRPPRGIRHR